MVAMCGWLQKGPGFDSQLRSSPDDFEVIQKNLIITSSLCVKKTGC